MTIFVNWNDKKTNNDITIQSNLVLDGTVKKMGEMEIQEEKIKMMKKSDKFELFGEIESLRKEFREMKEELNGKIDKILVGGKNKGSKMKMMSTESKIGGAITTTEGETPNQQEEGINMTYLTSLCTAYIAKFRINGNLVQYVGEQAWTQIFFNSYIPMTSQYVFKLRVIRTPPGGMNLMVGVVDYVKQKDQRTSFASKNALCYYSSGGKGYIQPGQTEQGKGFSQNQLIEVHVNRKDKEIRWIVAGQERAKLTDAILGDKMRIFLPYIEFFYTNDIVELIQC